MGKCRARLTIYIHMWNIKIGLYIHNCKQLLLELYFQVDWLFIPIPVQLALGKRHSFSCRLSCSQSLCNT